MFLDLYIGELLLKNDCVVVPGFGGFVTAYQPARIDSERQMIWPPAKGIIFNSRLTRNDGLLAHCIQNAEGCDYDQAMKMIGEKVENWSALLQTGRRLELDKIGVLFLNPEGRIQFDHSGEANFLMASFGLSPLSCSPKRVEEIREEKQAPILPITVLPEREKQIPGFNRRKYLAAAGLLLPLIGAAYLSLSQPKWMSQGSAQLAEILPLVEQGLPSYKPNFNWENEDSETSDISEPSAQIHQEVFFKVFGEMNSGGVWVNSSEKMDLSLKDYQVVLGCFRKKKHADRLVNSLIEKGLNPYLIQDSSSLIRVSVGGFAKKEDANRLKAQMQEFGFEDAWAWHKRR